MCTIYHSLFNVERAVSIKSNSMFNLSDLMTISLPKADRKNLRWRFETITSVWCLNVKKMSFYGCSPFTKKSPRRTHHLLIWLICWLVFALCHSISISVTYRRSVNLTTLFLDLRPPYDQRKLCDRAEVQTRVSAVRCAADCASDHSS